MLAPVMGLGAITVSQQGFWFQLMTALSMPVQKPGFYSANGQISSAYPRRNRVSSNTEPVF